MTLLIQHGYGKSNKIDRALAAENAAGVIFSPRDEKPDALEECVERLVRANDSAVIAMDPQFYVSTINNPRAGKLSQYPFFESGLQYSDFIHSANISKWVKSVVDFQKELDLTHVIAPTVYFEMFGDRWNSASFLMAVESMDYYVDASRNRPMLLSFVIHERAFTIEEQLKDFLDIITEFPCAGFYFIICREKN